MKGMKTATIALAAIFAASSVFAKPFYKFESSALLQNERTLAEGKLTAGDRITVTALTWQKKNDQIDDLVMTTPISMEVTFAGIVVNKNSQVRMAIMDGHGDIFQIDPKSVFVQTGERALENSNWDTLTYQLINPENPAKALPDSLVLANTLQSEDSCTILAPGKSKVKATSNDGIFSGNYIGTKIDLGALYYIISTKSGEIALPASKVFALELL